MKPETSQKILGNIWGIVIISILYVLPFSIKISNILVVALVLVSIVIRYKKNGPTLNITDLLIVCIPFLVSLFGSLYSNNLPRAFSTIETRLPLFLIPIAFGVTEPTTMDRKTIIRHFIFSLLFTFIVLFVIAVRNNIADPGNYYWFNKWYFQYSDFTNQIGIDPLYIGLYVSTGILVLFFSIISDQGSYFRKPTTIFYLFILVVFLAMIGVRSLLIAVSLILVIGSIFLGGAKKIVFTSLVLFFLFAMSLMAPVTRERFEGIFKENYQFTTYSIDRIFIWSTAANHILEAHNDYLFGKGLGSSEATMSELYAMQNVNWDFEKKTNTHNQFLSFILDVGFFGLVFLGVFFVFVGIRFYRQRDYLALIVLFLFICGLFVENYFDRQKGVVFISLFYSLFFFGKNIQHLERNIGTYSQK